MSEPFFLCISKRNKNCMIILQKCTFSLLQMVLSRFSLPCSAPTPAQDGSSLNFFIPRANRPAHQLVVQNSTF